MELKTASRARVPSIVALMGSRSLFGAERANIDLLRRMQKAGAGVLCLVRDEDWPENLKLRRFIEANGLEWRACPFPSYPTWRYWRYWPNVLYENTRAFLVGNHRLKQICQEIGATHIHTFNPFLTMSFWPAIESLRLPLIYRCGERPVDHNLLYKMTWRWLRRRISHVGTESKYLRDLLLLKKFTWEQITVIPAPPPVRNVETTSLEIRALKDETPFRFGYVGQVASFKGVGFLLEALAIVHREFGDAKLVLAGPLNDEWARELEFQAKTRFGTNSLDFLGDIEDVPAMLSSCDVHVAPSLKPEGYGLVAVEAKQAGIPSIVFGGGGLGELVEHGVDGMVVTEKTPEALAEAMLAYCRDPLRAKTEGDRAKASLIGRLGTHLYAERWQAIYNETMLRC